MNNCEFKNLVRRILKEEVEKSFLRVPEMSGNGIDPAKKTKRFGSDANSRDNKSKDQLIDDLSKMVGDDKGISVQWNDNDYLMDNARDLKFFRISPRWEDSYVIEMMTRNEDRIWVTGQSWEQVKEFVKVNLKDLNKQPTAVDKAAAKVVKNQKDQTPTNDKGLFQKDKPKILPLTNEEPSTSKNKDKNYTEKPKDDDDLPEKPMKEVKDGKKLIDYKVKDPVKLKRRSPNTTLSVKMEKQNTSRF